MPVCPECKGTHLQQGDNHSLMYCPNCKTSFRLYPVEPPMVLRKAIVGHLRWIMRAVRDKNSKLGLIENDQLEGLARLDWLLRLFREEE